MKTHRLKKVVVIGPESTGKSTLCEQLAHHYNTFWCAEYAREYLQQNGTAYVYEDLLKIAAGQLRLEDAATNSAIAENKPLLFIDTNMYVMKVWAEFVFHKSAELIEQAIKTREYDLYLLCNIDLPWVADDLREYPDVETRKRLFNIYHDLLQQQNIPWQMVQGNYAERVQSAIDAVDLLLL